MLVSWVPSFLSASHPRLKPPWLVIQLVVIPVPCGSSTPFAYRLCRKYRVVCNLISKPF
ncbi:hypothetical protein BDV34DRAFT_193152 [Aspergillus parasiticus]|uniref:Uncharacterized protein n=2 Tax=Aspergillus subgen. Circumdati TaxID=2720871 RepID=A0A5N6DQ89_ASPPA|nr:hypothetical protein BDV34DRAFT_193152 [Aspergillus parasiticus]KAE8319660.1 hypothetical protein BDV41DRAFT_517987 [Aspergillus transmontanensis]